MGELDRIPVLFSKKENCCGCGACMNICSKQAIVLKEDECGFIYPVIDESKCVQCGLCKTVCAFQNNIVTNTPMECYAAISNYPDQAKLSASAGIFAAMATEVINMGGIVYGAAFDEDWNVHHISAENIDQLCALQGSKYAHSDIGRTYTEVKKQLLSGRSVLFSGTPCQVAGLQGYLGREYDRLLTVDIVCHGVPSNRMLHDYLKMLEKKHRGKLSAFTFRDKSLGWGKNGSAVINKKKIKIWESSSSYFYFFSKGWIYRENCYQCPYACEHRPADITIGDYWGIEKQHPEFLGKNGWDGNQAVSCVVVNTNKGKLLLQRVNIKKQFSSFAKVSERNGQLKSPCDPDIRNEIIKIYIKNGWEGLDERYNKMIGLQKYSSQIKSIIPEKIKRKLKARL